MSIKNVTISQNSLKNKENVFYSLMTVPAVIVTFLVAILPLLLLFIDSFREQDTGRFTFINYIETLTNTFFLKLILSTLIVSLATTLLSIILAFPIAYFLARNEKLRGFLLCFVTIPNMLPFVVIGYALILLLAPYTGFFTILLVNQLHILKQPINILFDWPGLLIGMVYSRVIMAIGVLSGVIGDIDISMEEASNTLGASKLKTFFKIILPLSIPGVIGAFGIIFASSITAYVIPTMLAGKRMLMVSVMIASNLVTMGRWNLAFAQAIVVALISLTCVFVSQSLLKRCQRR